MFRNYLATALRNLVRNKLYAAINIAGLAVGFAAALLIALFVRDEFSYDRMFPDYQHIYLVGSELSISGRAKEYPDSTPAELAPLLKADFPSVAEITRVGPENVSIKRGAIENVEHVVWADPTVFDIFKFKVIAGNLETALKDSNGVVLTQKMARKYFGRNDPVGETLEFGIFIGAGRAGQGTIKTDVFTVTAVIADLPSNTTLDIDVIANAENADSFIRRIDNQPPDGSEYSVNAFTYLKFANDAAVDQMQDGLVDFMKRYKSGSANPGGEVYVKLILRPIASLHFASGTFGVQKPRGDIGTVYAVAVIGLLIVLAASINFVNLMTARAMRRGPEVGVRKTAGATRLNLMTQFLGEATIYVAIGMGLAMMLAVVLVPHLNTLLDRTITVDLMTDIRPAGFLIVLVILIGVLAGTYPAFVLAAVRPATVLRRNVSQQASSRVRQSLVVLQFAVLIGLLIPTSVVYRQTQFALNEAKRLDTDQVVLITGDPCGGAFKNVLSMIPGVRGVACSTSRALGVGVTNAPAKDANGSYVTMERASVGYGFFEFYDLKLVAGRFFSEAHPADTMPADENAPVQGAVVLNEAAVRRLGFASPQDAVGKSTSLNDETGAPSEIIGVVQDFAVDAVHKVIPPIAYIAGRDRLDTLSVRINGISASETLSAIDNLWKQVGPPQPMAREFLDQRIAQLYQDIARQSTLFEIFAAAAVAIASLGLFGLAAFTAEQRTKEIGIRKAMGARTGDILGLMLWQFCKPVLWANLIAWPVGYVVMRRWLEGFAYHIDLSPWMFLAASAVAIVIAGLTVVGHALLVARAQPVTALRYE